MSTVLPLSAPSRLRVGRFDARGGAEYAEGWCTRRLLSMVCSILTNKTDLCENCYNPLYRSCHRAKALGYPGRSPPARARIVRPTPGAGETPPPVRAPPARTPTETLQPRRGFHALSEGFSPHPLSFRAPGRPNAPFSFCGRRENATSGARASGAHPGRDAPAPQGLPRAQRGLQPAPALVSDIRTPKRPLLPVWVERGGFAGRLSTVSVPPNARADPSVS
jgi:hypothetical protein